MDPPPFTNTPGRRQNDQRPYLPSLLPPPHHLMCTHTGAHGSQGVPGQHGALHSNATQQAPGLTLPLTRPLSGFDDANNMRQSFNQVFGHMQAPSYQHLPMLTTNNGSFLPSPATAPQSSFQANPGICQDRNTPAARLGNETVPGDLGLPSEGLLEDLLAPDYEWPFADITAASQGQGMQQIMPGTIEPAAATSGGSAQQTKLDFSEFPDPFDFSVPYDPDQPLVDLEGKPIDLNDTVFDVFFNVNLSSNEQPVASSSMQADVQVDAKPVKNAATDAANPGTMSEPVSGPSDIGMHATQQPDDIIETPGPNVPPLQAKGKLQLVEEWPARSGKCEWISSWGNPCGRTAPVSAILNGPGGTCCICPSKHLSQWRRAHALPPDIKLIPMTLAQVKKGIYPDHEPIDEAQRREDPTLAMEQGQELKWQGRFLKAAMTPYTGDVEKLREQQICFNGNIECDEGKSHYTDEHVNLRMAALYHIAWNIHNGGERLYAVHGDNDGYPQEPADKRLKFRKRLELVESLLRENKRIVMDVIQGRGVVALVSSPLAYAQRKAINFENNSNKKRRSEDDEDDGELADKDGENSDTASPTPAPPKKRKVPKKAAIATKAVVKSKGKAREVSLPAVIDLSTAENDSKIAAAERAPAAQPLPIAENLHSGVTWATVPERRSPLFPLDPQLQALDSSSGARLLRRPTLEPPINWQGGTLAHVPGGPAARNSVVGHYHPQAVQVHHERNSGANGQIQWDQVPTRSNLPPQGSPPNDAMHWSRMKFSGVRGG